MLESRPGCSLGTLLADFAHAVAAFPDGPAPDAEAWRGITWGLVEGFRNWMVAQGDAVGSINVRLSTLKAYAKLATKAGVISAEEHAMIRTVAGYAHKEGRRIDERREQTRRGRQESPACVYQQSPGQEAAKPAGYPAGSERRTADVPAA